MNLPNIINGLSFMLRIRGVSHTIDYSIKSIKTKIPHEILVIFNGEIDPATMQKVKDLIPSIPEIKILVYPHMTSRPGLECAVTPPDDKHSLVFFMNWCVQQTIMNYIFKWDADWIAPEEMWKELEEKWENKDIIYVPVRFYNTGHDTVEPYIFKKAVFKEYVLSNIYESLVFKDGPKNTVQLNTAILHMQEDTFADRGKEVITLLRWWDNDTSKEATIAKNKYNTIEPIAKENNCSIIAHTAQQGTDNLYSVITQVNNAEDRKFRFHMLGLAHVPTHKDVCACAYTQKIVRMCKMLKAYGHTVFFYGGEGSEVVCDKQFEVVTDKQRKECYGDYDWKKDFFKHDPKDYVHRTFNKHAIEAINGHKKDTDILLCPMGNYNKPIADEVKLRFTVESGIGYSGVFCGFRIWESYAWMHHIYGQLRQEDGSWYDAVIPNTFDINDFHTGPKKDYYLYIGRLISRKGLSIAAEVTARLGKKLIVAGQGNLAKVDSYDLTKYKNIEHIGTVNPEQRADLMAGALATFVPTWYIGPFEGVHVESMLCGTPVISTDWGVFPETTIHGVTGYRCRTFNEFMHAAKKAPNLDGAIIQKYAQTNFSMERGASMYNAYFQSLCDITAKGWYTERLTPGWDRFDPKLTK